MPITTRLATPADIPTLLDFEQGIVGFERPFNPTLKPDPISYYDVAGMVHDPEVEVVVAVDDDLVVGSGYAKKKAASDYVTPSVHAFLGFMFVLPEYRGKGVNKLVMDDLLAWAKREGLSEIRLEVYAENAGAIRAYEKAGFGGLMLEMRREI
ncbi:MAG: GNAT superfamily N-acetyltransferase [Neolewinella sp.]|jgi:GNAT superfamily N-acetyltransferase